MKRCIALMTIAALSLVSARAHTNIVVAGFQIYPSGYVNGQGVAPNQRIDDGPATDGTLVFTNLDPVAHHFVECKPCDPVPIAAATPAINVTVATGEQKEFKITRGLGTYEYFDPAYPTMRGRARVTSQGE